MQKQILAVQKIHYRLDNIRYNYLHEVIDYVVKAKPQYVVMEDLNVKGMMKNRHLAKAIAEQNFYTFKAKLSGKVEIKTVSRFYPSSKKCSGCGNIKTDLKLSDQTYLC